jgi:uncharacterized protein (TIGR02391 family)
MAKRDLEVVHPRSDISLSEIPFAIRKFKRRLEELQNISERQGKVDRFGTAKIIANKINATTDDVFGEGTAEAKDFHIDWGWFILPAPGTPADLIEAFMRGRDRAIAVVQAALDRLKEKLDDGAEDATARTLSAYESLDLHPEIARAASDLYHDGHYANAVEDSVKALNGLVRLRSGLDIDGAPLMQKAFSPNSPILKFNDLSDQTDRDEQKGFMDMFCGAVAGLRNPRAHRFIKDNPERALDFIAFVSLLAKLLDEAKKA